MPRGITMGAFLGPLALALAGCGPAPLRDMGRGQDGPEEFSIEPAKPLEMPQDIAALPAPTPGGANRTDLTPRHDSVAALGGNPAALNPNTPIPARDAALVRHAARNGVPADIRTTLASEDQAFRNRKSRFTRIRLFKTDRYNQAYKAQSLDAHAALRQYRRAGVQGPSAPPGQ